MCHLFCISKLTCCEFVALGYDTLTHTFKNHYVKQIKLPPQRFSYEVIRMSHRGKLPCKSKNLNFLLLLNIKYLNIFSSTHYYYNTVFTLGVIYTNVILILIDQCLLNVVFGMTKISMHLLNAIWKTLLFSTLPFSFKLYNISPDAFPVVISWVVS